MSIEKSKALAFVNELITNGNIKAVIDRLYPLAQVAEAHTYVDRGHKRGNVVIDLDAEDIGASKDALRGSTSTLEAGEQSVHAS